VKPRVLFVVAKDGYFFSHRLQLAKRVQAAGYDVHLASPRGPYHDRIVESGVPVHVVPMDRQGRNPLSDVRTVGRLVALYRKLAPDVVHHVAIKPILYGSLAARVVGVPAVVNAVAGMGYVFLSTQLLSRIIRPGVKLSFRHLVNAPNARVILQNPDDIDRWVSWGVIRRDRIALIRGAGVDTELFCETPEPPGEPVVLLPARFLFDKGVAEFVSAARQLKAEGVKARFVLLGEPDAGNPSAVTPADLRAWEAEGVVTVAPWRDDVHNALSECHLVCLPSYGEGLPKALLEAAACGRAIVTTDVPGCREIVRHEDNGLLVPVRDAKGLADGIRALLVAPELRQRMGRRGRERAVSEFSADQVAQETLALYAELLSRGATGLGNAQARVRQG